MKVIEVMASSSKSWESATRNAIAHATKSVKILNMHLFNLKVL